jgi:hypothetical protein
MLQGLRATLEGVAGTGPKSILNQAMRAYSYIDFFGKYASYKTALRRGLSPEQAAEHVKKFYQNKDYVPQIFSKMSKSGAFDYVTYGIDSVRITKNQVVHAVQSAKAGDIAPMIGFLVGSAMTGTATWWGAKAVVAVREKFKKDTAADILSADEHEALRAIQPDYYANDEQIAWREKGPNGITLHYIAIANLDAYPYEAITRGLLLNGGNESYWEGVKDRATRGAVSNIGMGPQQIWTLATGTTPGIRGKTGAGLLTDIAFKAGPVTKKGEKIREALLRFGTSFTVPQVRQGYQAYKMGERQERALSYEYQPSAKPEDVFNAMLTAGDILYEPVQTTRIDTPAEYLSEASKLIGGRRGLVMDTPQQGTRYVIIADIPVSEMFGFETALKSATGGRGFQSLIDVSYKKLPADLQIQTIVRIRERKGLPKELPKPIFD